MALAEYLNDRTKQSFAGGELHIRNVATHYDLRGKIHEIVIAGFGVNVILSSVTIKMRDRVQKTDIDDLEQPICQDELAKVEALENGNGIRVIWNHNLTAVLQRPIKPVKEKEAAVAMMVA